MASGTYDTFDSGDEAEPGGAGAAGMPHQLLAGSVRSREPDTTRHVARRMGSQSTAPEADPVREQHSAGAAGDDASSRPVTNQQLQSLIQTISTQQSQALARLESTVQDLKDQLSQTTQDIKDKISSLETVQESLGVRLTAVEAKQQDCQQPVEDLRAQVEALQVQFSQLQAQTKSRVESIDIQDKATSIMIFGLPEEGAADGRALHRAVCDELVHAAEGHNFQADSVMAVSRLGKPNPDSDRPRPAVIRCQTVADKHCAFKARPALKARGMRLDDYLTGAQMAARRAQQPAMEHLRQQPGANPHFRGSVLHHWVNGRPIPYSASSGQPPVPQDSQPEGAPQRGGRRCGARSGSGPSGRGGAGQPAGNATRPARTTLPGPPRRGRPPAPAPRGSPGSAPRSRAGLSPISTPGDPSPSASRNARP